ncbi:MAG: hypothetical protein QOJ24_93 [Mycobacterium sp.]|jgi:hypothetical protein|nr:hypothetical protein [Mycobacterium sp.]
MFKFTLIAVAAAAGGLVLAAPASAQTPPIAEGAYTELLTASNGKIAVHPGIQVTWSCGPDCFQSGNYAYRFDPASNRWQTDPVPTSANCADGSTRTGNGVWWTTDGAHFNGDTFLADLCPEGPPATVKSELVKE